MPLIVTPRQLIQWSQLYQQLGQLTSAGISVLNALEARFPANPPRFLMRTPYGHHNIEHLTRDLTAAGFADISVDAVDATSKNAASFWRYLVMTIPVSVLYSKRRSGHSVFRARALGVSLRAARTCPATIALG